MASKDTRPKVVSPLETEQTPAPAAAQLADTLTIGDSLDTALTPGVPTPDVEHVPDGIGGSFIALAGGRKVRA